ncbi:PREDICTED: uncharacterized protein LOC109337777 [Lupinus angustifolius]|uniref:uncharacterized protein LOC109337777 n=1 Tax=Lupinus angustifolius TaxID=3871 RepID=UPI00092FA70B|nr:PREDICTED: uncharacterized protein LOC109337777 [Lupinus angustifolius]
MGSNYSLLFYAIHGIQHETTCVESPQQNGIAEKKLQHVLAVTSVQPPTTSPTQPIMPTYLDSLFPYTDDLSNDQVISTPAHESPQDSPSDSATPNIVNPPPPIRQSSRRSKPPLYLKDYHFTLATGCMTTPSSKIKYPISNFISYDYLSHAHKHYSLGISYVITPDSYQEAILNESWQQAINSELSALQKNGTRTITNLPDNKRAIGSKWIFKIKHKPDGSVERFKARLVAKGYNQTEGVYYHDNFSPIVKMTTIRVLLSLAVIHNYIKDIGNLKFFLGMEIARTSKGIALYQRKYVLDLLSETCTLAAKPCTAPMDYNTKLHSSSGSPLPDPAPYRKLLYLTNLRPDIIYAVSHLSQFNSKPTDQHQKASNMILKYLKSSPALGLFFPSQN